MNEAEPFDPAAHTDASRRSWTETAEAYERLSERLFAASAAEFVRFAGIRKGWRVYEAACGPGVATRAAAKAAGEKGFVLATDLAPGMIARAKAAPPPPRGSAPIEWRVMDAEEPDLPAASFDAAICQLGLMLFGRPDAALAGMVRAVKTGGVVACLVQGRREKMKFTSLVLETIVEFEPDLKAPPGAPTLYRFGHDGALEEIFAAAGLVEISTKRLSGDFYFPSAEEYWTTMTEGSGRTGAMLRSLDEETQAKVKKKVLRRAENYKRGRGVAVPYEFAMARATVPPRKEPR